MKRLLLTAGLALVAGALLVGCDDYNTVSRVSTPLVLTGADLPDLVGEDPDAIVAFAHERVGNDFVWTQIPVQVDERKVVGFGSQPANNNTPGVTGTVYGSGAPGPLALQYADPGTFVGPDTDPTFDADDELVFMIEDGGGKPRNDARSEPAGVVPDSGVRVQFDDPLDEDRSGWVHLFLSDGSISPDAGVDYVDYDFELTSGDYKTTYKRRVGPNPETSSVTTDAYTIEYTDRWFETVWRNHVDGASGVDVLDGNKNQFALNFCGRSNATFAAAEGAFVANIDGPVRGIRSYVGANSGPLTQRTHLMYRDQEIIDTDLRVHSIPAVMDYLDYSDAALGMTYVSSAVPDGVTVDRVPDAVGTDLPDWEYVTGPQGTMLTKVTYDTDIGAPGDFTDSVAWLYRDEADPSDTQCWGDAHHTGVHGPWVVETIPNTDPLAPPFKVLELTRTVRFAGPQATPESASAWAAQVDTPLAVTVSDYTLP